jgi:ankyrin repeat protein
VRASLTVSLVVALALASSLRAAPSPSAVADAAMKGDTAAVRALLKQGEDVNASQGDGMSALHWAADRNDAELADMLIYAGANVSAVTRIGAYTPLHLAAKAGSAAVERALVKAGADVGAKTTNTGVTPLHMAAASGSAEAVTALIEAKADVNARESEWGQTPLIFAAALNRVDAIKALLKGGADPGITTKSVDLVKQAALARAASQRQQKVIESFVGKGGQDKATPSQVQAAIEAGRELFASGKIPPPEPPAAAAGRGANAAGAPAGGTPAQTPAAANANSGNQRNAGAATGRQAAAGAAPADAPFDPLNFDPAQFQEQSSPVTTKGGLTALLHAARQGYTDVAMALIEGGADINQVGAGDQTSPLLMAVINGQFDFAMKLIERGANPNLSASGNGVAPLWAALNTQWQPRTRFPQPQELELQKATYLDVMKALLEKGADPDARLKGHPWYMVYSGCGNRNCGLEDTSGSTAFWRAAYATDLDAMKLLMKYGADPNIGTIAPAPPRRRGDGAGGAPFGPVDAKDDQSGLPSSVYGGLGALPLHAAAGVGYGEGFAGNAHRHAPDAWLSTVKYLVEELGADINARDANGYTALHHAAARGDDAMILYLVSKGADVTVVSRRGQTVADMANGPVQRVSPFPETVKLLEKLGSKNSHKCVTC